MSGTDCDEGNDKDNSVNLGRQLVLSPQQACLPSQGLRREVEMTRVQAEKEKLEEATSASIARRAQHEADEAMAIQAKARPYADIIFVGKVVWNTETKLPTDVIFLRCDGAAVSRAKYVDLFISIGTLYGQGDGVTTFNLPDLRGRTVAGL